MTIPAMMTPFGFAVNESYRKEEERFNEMGNAHGGGVDIFHSVLTAIKYIPLLGSVVVYFQWERVTMVLDTLSEIEKQKKDSNEEVGCVTHNFAYSPVNQKKRPTDRMTLLIYKVRLFVEMCGLGLLFLPLDLVVTGGRALGSLYQRCTQGQGGKKPESEL